MIRQANDIEHRLTKPNQPWTNGQVERTSRMIKEAALRRYHSDGHQQLRVHLELFLDASNHARRLKSLKGLAPSQLTRKEWQARPNLLCEEPCQLTVGPCT